VRKHGEHVTSNTHYHDSDDDTSDTTVTHPVEADTPSSSSSRCTAGVTAYTVAGCSSPAAVAVAAHRTLGLTRGRGGPGVLIISSGGGEGRGAS